ncbi:hypothetical protein HJD18_03510 [Thermoleophilia bacterium SCSIO 60948]|nr:hypothetical protein HJD18_03510 [Thermoleophilia bacterium SCSIO 60948]
MSAVRRHGRIGSALTLALCVLLAGCESQGAPPAPQASTQPVYRLQVCWGPNALATNLGEPAGSVYGPWRRRSIEPAWFGEAELRHSIRGSVLLMLRHDWRELLEGGASGAEQVVAEGREAAADLLANPSVFRRRGTLRDTFAEAQATATELGFSTCTLNREP